MQKNQTEQIIKHFQNKFLKKVVIKNKVKNLKTANFKFQFSLTSHIFKQNDKLKIAKNLKCKTYKISFSLSFFKSPKKLVYNDEISEQIIKNSMLAYVAFFIPLVKNKNSSFARFHANQSLIMFLISVCLIGFAVGVFFVFVPLGIVLLPISLLCCFLMVLSGMYNAKNAQIKSFFGKLKLIKY